MEEEQSRLHLLTAMQLRVLHWIAEAKTNAEIATILILSPHTIRTHVQRILKRLLVENRTAAALHFLKFRDPLRNYA